MSNGQFQGPVIQKYDIVIQGDLRGQFYFIHRSLLTLFRRPFQRLSIFI